VWCSRCGYCTGESDAVAAAGSTLLHRRRCRSITCINDVADNSVDSHIDRMFCTAQHQQQQQLLLGENEESQRSSSYVNSSENNSQLHGDTDSSCLGVAKDTAACRRRGQTVDDMFCTKWSTLDYSPPPITSSRSMSAADSVRKQVS